MFHGITFRSRIFFFYSQLNFPVFKLFQCPFPLTRGESGGELGGLNSSKELHQEQKSDRGTGKKQYKVVFFFDERKVSTGVIFSNLCAVSLELVKQRMGLSFMRRMKWRMSSGFLLSVQGT